MIEFSYHLSPHEVTTMSLTVSLMLYITSPWLPYLVTGYFCLLIPFTCFDHSPPPPTSGNYQLVLYVCGLFPWWWWWWSFLFVLFFRFHI